MSTTPISRRLILISALSSAGMVALSACGSSDATTTSGAAASSAGTSSGAGDSSYAQSIVDKYANAAIAWAGPTDSVAMATKKKVVVVALTMTSVSNQRVSAGFKEAAELGGWDVTIIDGAGVADKFSGGIDTAIAQKADAIVLMGTQPVPEALDRAKKAGIPVVGSIDAITNPLFANTAYSHMVFEKGTEIGAAAAAQLVVDLGPDAPVGTFAAAKGDPLGDLLVGGADEVFAMSGNPVKSKLSLEFAELGTGTIGQKAVAAVQANPEIKAFWVSWDGAGGEVVTAFQNAGITIPVYSTYADPQDIDFMRNDVNQKADVAVALEWDGWAIADNLNRIFAGTPLGRDTDDGVPIKLLNSSNLAKVLPGDQTAWTGEFDFRSEYKKLWGTN